MIRKGFILFWLNRNQYRCHHKYIFLPIFFLLFISFYLPLSVPYHLFSFHLMFKADQFIHTLVDDDNDNDNDIGKIRNENNAKQVGQMKCKFIGCRTHWIKNAFLFCSNSDAFSNIYIFPSSYVCCFEIVYIYLSFGIWHQNQRLYVQMEKDQRQITE